MNTKHINEMVKAMNELNKAVSITEKQIRLGHNAIGQILQMRLA